MSADLLREAADAVRAEWEPEQSGPFRYAARTHLAVADWLEGVAAWDDEGLGHTERLNQTNWPSMWGDMQVSALAVARAYLGRDA